MSMRTWVRKMAHAKAEAYGATKENKPQYFAGKVQPSVFAVRWREMAALPAPKRK